MVSIIKDGINGKINTLIDVVANCSKHEDINVTEERSLHQLMCVVFKTILLYVLGHW